jgi:beta-glucosidase/6-phospho-beta-glucosidase/beta-galactosidase
VHLGAAPGLRLSDSDLKQVRHHAVLAHGLGVQAIRSQAPAGTDVCFAENTRVAIPVINARDYVAAAEKATRDRDAGFMTVMLEGRYTDEYLTEAGGGSPTFTDDELKTIAEPLDFVGINVYKPGWYVQPPTSRPGTRTSRSTRRTPRCCRRGTSSIRKSCTGRRSWCKASGTRGRSSSPRTDAAPQTSSPRTAGSTTPTG